MIRWSYLVPRLIILGLILLAVWISVDPILKYGIVKSTESVTGAKVEVGKVKSSLLKGKVYLQELAISDPRDPMQNLIQADVAYLQLNPQSLLLRELIIEHGHSKDVMFAAPRTVSGELPGRVYPTRKAEEWITANVEDKTFASSRRWLDSIQSSVARKSAKDLELVKVAEEIQQKWPPLFERKRAEIANVKNQVAALKRKIEKPRNKSLVNPLRNEEQPEDLTVEFQMLQKRLNRSRQEMTELVKAANRDIERVNQAKLQDNAKVSQYVTSTADADTFSQLLLAKDQSERLKEVIHWVQWFRHSIPNPETDFQPSQNRGTNVSFQGQLDKPQFLIKNLELEGQGTITQQHFDFAGVAKNLTTQPRLHDKPATFELRAQGEHHLIVNCTVDRRNDTWVDKMEITCPNLQISEQNLGDGKTLVVQSRPSRMQANVSIEIVGDQLSGTLEFRHSNCSLYIEQIDEFAGGQDMQLRMNQELAQIQQFNTYATLGGTLDNPTIDFRSNLGQEFARSMSRIVKDQADQRVADLKMQIDQRCIQEVYELNQMLQQNFREIAQLLDGESTAVAELINSVPEKDDQWRR